MPSGQAKYLTKHPRQDSCRVFLKRTPAIFLSILLAAGIFSLIQSPIRVHAATGLAIDGSGTGWCGHNTNSCTANLTTSHGNDLIVVYTTEALDLQTSCIF